MLHLELSRNADKELTKIPSEYKGRVIDKLIDLRKDPYIGKKLHGEYKECRSVYVWPYRIIYKIRKEELLVLVVKIGHRQGVYK